jgi:hypothetical protein
MSDEFYAGCTQAKVKLSTSDTLRKTVSNYKAGWNAWTPSAGAASAAPQAVPAQLEGASSPSTSRARNEAPTIDSRASQQPQAAAAATPTPTPDAELPDRTPEGTPIEKQTFYLGYRMGVVDNIGGLLRVTDTAVTMAHEDGLRCDSVTLLKPWEFSKGWTLQCNHWDYKYYVEDKGRGWQIRIAD